MGIDTRLIANREFRSPGPIIATMAMARSVDGNASRMSRQKLITRSIRRPAYPATAPRSARPSSREWPSVVLDARVRHGVQEIRDEVHRHEDHRDEQARPLDDRVIARLARLVDPPPHPPAREGRLPQ